MSARLAGRGPGILAAWLVALLALALVWAALYAANAVQVSAAVPAAVLIDAVYADSYELNDADEAIGLRNVTDVPVDVSGWYVTDGGTTKAELPPGTILQPDTLFWITRDSAAFERQFVFAADLETAVWPGYANAGDEVLLHDAAGNLIDVVVYGGNPREQTGWSGPPIAAYTVAGSFAAEGQILFRRRDPQTGRPVPDTDRQQDWAQTMGDPIDGRQVRYPGWDSDAYFFPLSISASSALTIAVAPDNAYEAVVDFIRSARTSIRLASLTIEHPGIMGELVAAAGRGVAVTALLEGGPVGGLSDQERYLCRRLAVAGGACWFMVSDPDNRIHDRYRFMHAKYIVVDQLRSAVSTENFSLNSLPDDPKGDGTWGRRGVILFSDAPELAAHLETLFAVDRDPRHPDIRRWEPDDPFYGPPPPGFLPVTSSGGITYTVRYTTPLVVTGPMTMELVQSPDNSLRATDGVLGLVNRAGAGDTVLVQQLSERPHWGPSDADPVTHPNPRLEAYLAAARRGAAVRLLLDAYFDYAPDHPLSNAATCRAVNEAARAEKLDIVCELGNPTGLGIHNKMVLAELDGRGFIHVGSLNGTELSHKGNREVALLVQSDAAYRYLADLFTRDRTHRATLPLVMAGVRGPARHLLISEVYYDPPGFDTAEFVEIVNPTIAPISLAGLTLGDAVRPEDFEDVRVFPAGTVLGPGETLVVATTASAFASQFGFLPDLEIVDSDPTVPDMLDEPGWGDPQALFQLGNSGDEVILRRGHEPIDIVVYGDGMYPGVEPCPLLTPPNRTLERYPYWHDRDSCVHDFRGWPFANPGQLPDGQRTEVQGVLTAFSQQPVDLTANLGQIVQP